MIPAGEHPGAVVTRPFKLSTSKISLNADARNGESAIDVLDVDGQLIKECSGTNGASHKNSDELPGGGFEPTVQLGMVS